jgi:ribosomal protein S18 acetylase RimI-like enzyme
LSPHESQPDRCEPGIVRRAAPGDEEALRRVRLAALADAPDAFESTLDRELDRPLSEWQRWLTHGAVFLFEDAGEPRGIAAGIPHTDVPSAAFLVSMWVAPAHRGTGAADTLVASVLAWAQTQGVREVWLHVGKENDRARRLYERHGFRATGETMRPRDGAVEIEMRRPIDVPARKEPT